MTFDTADVEEYVQDGRLCIVHKPTQIIIKWHEVDVSPRMHEHLYADLQWRVEVAPA